MGSACSLLLEKGTSGERVPGKLQRSRTESEGPSGEMTPVTPITLSKLSDQEEAIIAQSFPDLMTRRPDFFHKVWMKSIQKSPRMNEIIALNHYCVRDLTKWPKLNSLAKAVQTLFTDFIALGLSSPEARLVEVSQRSRALGAKHVDYSAFGFQPVYFDIWIHSFDEVFATVKLEDEEHKAVLARVWHKWIKVVTEWMQLGYNQARRSNAFRKTNSTKSLPLPESA